MPDENEVLGDTLSTQVSTDDAGEDNDSSTSKGDEDTLLGGAKDEEKTSEEDEEDEEEEEESSEEDEEDEEDEEESSELKQKNGKIKNGKYIIDDYEIIIPKGQEFNNELLDSVIPIFQDLDLDNDAVQKIIDGYSKAVRTQIDNHLKKEMKGYQELTEGWKKQSLKELGADSQKKLSIAAKARDKLGDAEFVEMLKQTGIGNHPAMIRMLIKAGELVREDSFPDPNQPGNTKKISPEKVLYPSMEK